MATSSKNTGAPWRPLIEAAEQRDADACSGSKHVTDALMHILGVYAKRRQAAAKAQRARPVLFIKKSAPQTGRTTARGSRSLSAEELILIAGRLARC